MKAATTLGRYAPGANWFDLAAILLLLGLIVIVAIFYGDYAISNDEGVQQRYGELIIRYYASGMTDRSLFDLDNLYLYGGLFDVVATLLAKVLPLDLYSVRHILCALTGIGGIAAVWACARMIAGPRAGLLAALMLTVCGVWFGGMFNHTKDVTFAAAMMAATFFLLRVMRDLPRPRPCDVLLLGLFAGAALGLRALGLMLPVYGVAAILMATASANLDSGRERLKFFIRSCLAVCPAVVLAYLIMIAAWPWAALDLLNPVRGLVAFSHFQYPVRTLLDGQTYDMMQIPRWYVPAYLLIRLPLMLLGTVALAVLFVSVPRFSRTITPAWSRRAIVLLVFSAAFPIVAHVVDHGPAFSGLRHFIFVIPPMAVLAGIGCDGLLTRLAMWRPPVAAVAGTAVVAMLLWNAITLVRLHPHEYLFYNSLVGGLEGATGRYDTDYWVNMMPEAVRALDSYLTGTDTTGEQAPYMVTVCADRLQFEKVATPRMRWTDDWSQADFFISPTHMNCDRMLEGSVIVSIRRLNALIGVVKDRRTVTRPELAHVDAPSDASEF